MNQPTAIGILELSSVAAGVLAADTMLKAADVELRLSRSICSGKYMVLVGGGPAAVASAIAAGAEAAAGCVIDRFVIAQLHPAVLEAIGRGSAVPAPGLALGIVEAFNVAALVRAADAAVKCAPVELLEVRLAMALGGKAFCSVAGDVASVQAAVAAAREIVAGAGALVNAVVIANPHPAVCRELA